jgi:hypothetical protein
MSVKLNVGIMGLVPPQVMDWDQKHLAGYGLGVVFFGVAGVWLCFHVLGKLERDAAAAAA